MNQIVKGFSAAYKFCSKNNLPKFTKTTYENQEGFF